MKKRKIACLAAAILMLTACPSSLHFSLTSKAQTAVIAEATDGDADKNVSIYLSQDDLNAYGSENIGYVIQNALNEANLNATKEHPYVITIAPGSYNINNLLSLYSHTTLNLTGVTLTRQREQNFIMVGPYNTNAGSGNSGYYYDDIHIIGGTIDGNNICATVIKAGHITDFSMTGTTVMNTVNAHLMETGGVDGLIIKDCTFKNQEIDGTDYINRYEAIQLDINYNAHLNGYRSEALQTKNVYVEGCTFENVPRGIGSHTAILNEPFDNINVTNCIFKNNISCGIQGLYWTNSNISGNTISGTPRGISLYSIMNNGQGVYKASTVSAEGNLSSAVSDDYLPIDNYNIKISNNTITLNDAVDPTADYAKGAIILTGTDITKVSINSDDNSGGIPVGAYPLKGVTVKDNIITTKNNGIRIINSQDCVLDNNSVTTASKGNTDFYGLLIFSGSKNISALRNSVIGPFANGLFVKESTAANLDYNMISGSTGSCVQIYSNCTVSSFSYNTISDSGSIGVAVSTGCKVTKLNNNTISDSITAGIQLYNGCSSSTINDNGIYDIKKEASGNNGHGIRIFTSTAGDISGNSINSVPKYGINILEGSTVTTVSNNNIISPGETGIYLARSTGSAISTVNTISGNTISRSGIDGIKIYNKCNAKYIKNNKITNAGRYGIFFFTSATGTSITGNEVTGAKSKAIHIDSTSKVPTVSGNYTVATPTLVAASGAVSSAKAAVKVSWKPTAGATGYNVYRKTATTSWSKIGTTESNSSVTYYDKTASSGKKYYYTVIATVKGAVSSKYNTTGVSVDYLAAPVISGIANTTTGIYMKWNKVASSEKYYLYRKTSGGSWKKIATLGSTTLTYLDKNVSNGTSYYYTLRAANSKVTSAYNTSGNMMVRLSKMSIKSLKNSSSKAIKISYSQNTKVTGYQIVYSTSSSFSSYKYKNVTSYKTVSQLITSLSKGKTYYVRVRPYKKVGSKYYFGTYSTTSKVKISR